RRSAANQFESMRLDKPAHLRRWMNKRAEAAFPCALRIVEPDDYSNVPTILRIRDRETIVAVAHRIVEQPLVARITAHHTIERDDGGRRDLDRQIDEISPLDLNGGCAIASACFFLHSRRVSARRLDDDSAAHSAVEQLERERTNSRAHVQ